MTKGTYCLLMYLDRDKSIKIGKNKRKFRQGYYVYTGSALGGLHARLRRHLSKNKKLKWHIDYLLEHARITDIAKVYSTRKLECRVNSLIKSSGGVPIKGFGSSDCKCDTHLHYFEKHPNIRIKTPL